MTDQAHTNADLHIGLKIIAFLMPIVGLILFLVYKSDAPLKSKSAGKWGLIGLLVGIVFTILSAVLGASMLSSM